MGGGIRNCSKNFIKRSQLERKVNCVLPPLQLTFIHIWTYYNITISIQDTKQVFINRIESVLNIIVKYLIYHRFESSKLECFEVWTTSHKNKASV